MERDWKTSSSVRRSHEQCSGSCNHPTCLNIVSNCPPNSRCAFLSSQHRSFCLHPGTAGTVAQHFFHSSGTSSSSGKIHSCRLCRCDLYHGRLSASGVPRQADTTGMRIASLRLSRWRTSVVCSVLTLTSYAHTGRSVGWHGIALPRLIIVMSCHLAFFCSGEVSARGGVTGAEAAVAAIIIGLGL